MKKIFNLTLFMFMISCGSNVKQENKTMFDNQSENEPFAFIILMIIVAGIIIAIIKLFDL